MDERLEVCPLCGRGDPEVGGEKTPLLRCLNKKTGKEERGCLFCATSEQRILQDDIPEDMTRWFLFDRYYVIAKS